MACLRRSLGVASLLAGCGPSIAIDDGEATTSGPVAMTTTGPSIPPATSGDDDVPTVPPDPFDDDGGVTTGPVLDGTTDDGIVDEDGSCLFLCPPDGGPLDFECDVLAQDCPVGEKCMPWANDGGPAWNATRCSPLAADPGQVGDACLVEGSGVSGIDDCDLGLMCWNVDDNGEGYCQDMCTGTYREPMCADPADACSIANDGAIALCLATCDPVLQDCAVDGEVCYPMGDAWVCSPQFGGAGYGEACNGACAAGSCISPAAFSQCDGGFGCCTSYCNVEDAASDAFCQSLDPIQTCEPFYSEGQAPDGYAHVGICTVPM